MNKTPRKTVLALTAPLSITAQPYGAVDGGMVSWG